MEWRRRRFRGGKAPGWNDGGEDSGCETPGEGGLSVDWIPDALHPDGMADERNSGSETPGWNGDGEDSGGEAPGWNDGGEKFRV